MLNISQPYRPMRSVRGKALLQDETVHEINVTYILQNKDIPVAWKRNR
jgi:hypothetical protein